MKKLALSLAVLFAVGMVSCGGNKEKEECADTTAPVVEEVGVVEVATDSTANAQEDTTLAAEGAVENPAPAPENPTEAK